MRSEFPDQLNKKNRRWSEGAGTAAAGGGGGAGERRQLELIVLNTDRWGGSRRRRSGVKVHSRGWRREFRSRATEWEFVIVLHDDANTEKYYHTQSEASFIKAWLLDVSVRIHIFLHFDQCLKLTPSSFYTSRIIINRFNVSDSLSADQQGLIGLKTAVWLGVTFKVLVRQWRINQEI